MDWQLIQRTMNCFPRSFINRLGELIVHQKSNTYFNLMNCETEFDIKCKMLEWLSRASYKTCPYGSDRRNKEFHNFIRNGVNEFLGTDFSEEDMDLIYTYLGNECNHEKTVQFIKSGYDMSILEDKS